MRTSGIRLVMTIVAASAMMSCAPTYRDIFPTLADGKYDSEFPYRACSKQLEEIAESIQMVNGIGYYRDYTFEEREKVTRLSVTPELLAGREARTTIFPSQLSGTATIITADDRHAVLMTCAHVVDFPDTVYAYYPGPDYKPGPYIRAIAVKEKQSIYVALLPEGGEIDILAMDRELDVALLGKTFSRPPFPMVRAFPYPAGRARELEWGTFVYLFGYPSGRKMITKAIVSNPNKDRAGSFFIDAVFNKGFSGGIALAVRDGVPNFELAGMVRMMLAHTSFVLGPPPDDSGVAYDTSVPYSGDMYVQRHTEIEYGMAQAIPIESIQEFIERQAPALERRGYAVHFGAPPVVP
jgi:hypothetical protein